MMRAYLDESGHEGKSWVIVGGFFGPDQAWADLVPHWKSALGRQRKSLHMSALRWKNDSTRRLLERLGPIPKQCGLKAAIGGVKVADYVDLVAGTPQEKILKGYVVALNPLVVQVLRAVPDTERIEFVFEEQREYMQAVDRTMSYFSVPDRPYKRTKDGRPKIAKWGFVPKHSTMMTEPADYLASAMRHHCETPHSQKAKWCHPMLASGDGTAYGAVLRRDEVRRNVSRTSEIARLLEDAW